MDFLRRHYEKLVLGAALFGFLASCYYLLDSLKAARLLVQEVRQKADQAVVEGQRLDSFDASEFDATAILALPDLELTVAGDPTAGGLVEPLRMIRCLNPDCSYLMPFATDVCPFCGTVQPPVKVEEKQVDVGLDSDGDGIPDVVEQQHHFLNPFDATDAHQDHDADLFTNIEEYRLGTDMADAASYPPLANLLRTVSIFRRTVPIRLNQVVRNNTEDQTRWDIHFRVVDPRTGRERMEFPRLGGTVLGYTVKEVLFSTEERLDPRTSSMRTVDVSEVVVQAPATGDKEGETYTLRVGEQLEERELQAALLYLTDRRNPQRCVRIPVKLGTTIPLRHPVSGETQSHRVTALSPQEVTLQRLETEGEPTDFVVKRLAESDFIRSAAQAPERERMMPDYP